MDIGSIFLILAVLVPVVLFIARPLMEGSATAVTAEEHQYSALLAERDRILNAVQELDFDYALGKIPNDEYPNQRASLMRVGAEILRKIDEYEGNTAEGETDARMETSIGAAAADATAVDVAGCSNLYADSAKIVLPLEITNFLEPVMNFDKIVLRWRYEQKSIPQRCQ